MFHHGQVEIAVEPVQLVFIFISRSLGTVKVQSDVLVLFLDRVAIYIVTGGYRTQAGGVERPNGMTRLIVQEADWIALGIVLDSRSCRDALDYVSFLIEAFFTHWVIE